MPLLPTPQPHNVFEEDGLTYVRARSGPMLIDDWRIIQHLYRANDTELVNWCVLLSGDVPYQVGMDTYGEPETHTGYVAYIRLHRDRWAAVQLTVEYLEALP
jgi:hypothetical protein